MWSEQVRYKQTPWIVTANSLTNTFKHRLDIYRIGKTRRLSTIFVHSYREPEVVVTYSDLIQLTMLKCEMREA